MISKEKYNFIKEKYGNCASWAIWAEVGETPTSNMEDLEIFDIEKNPSLLSNLNPNIVLVGLNISKDIHLDTFANFHAGGTAVKTTLSPREKQICSTIKSFLKTKKLFFVGIDVIDGYLTEINITSPTGIQEINRLNKVNIEKDVIDFVEKSLQ